MRAVRFFIAGMMAVVLVAGIGLAGLRAGSEAWTGGFILATRMALGLALVGALCRRGEKRAWWLGFAMFGWIYMRCSSAIYDLWPKLPTQVLFDEIVARTLGEVARFGFERPGLESQCVLIWHCLWTLLAAVFGGLMARAIFDAIAGRAGENAPGSEATGQRPRSRWAGITSLYSSGAALVVLVVFGGRFLASGLWAGLTFLLTLWLLGLFALRASFVDGKQRELWLGAAVMGVGFMIMAFGRFHGDPWPTTPTALLLDDLRPRLPAVMSGDPDGWDSRRAENASVFESLERNVRMEFDEETPLEDVLKHIEMETVGTDGKPIGIQLGELSTSMETLFSTFPVRSVDLDGVALRTSLKVCLDQLNCTYHVKDGALVIHSVESDEEARLAARKDAYQIVGHCVLALFAAVIGGVTVPLIRERSRRGHHDTASVPVRT